MFMFVQESNSWKMRILESVLILKKLHDRGFNISKINKFTSEFFLDCLTVIFGISNVTETEMNIQPPPDMETMDVDSEEYYMLQRYLNRYHYHVNVKIKELKLFAPDRLDSLMKILMELCPSKEEIDFYDGFPHSAIIEKIEWVPGEGDKSAGVWFHYVEPDDLWDELSFSYGHYINLIIMFWDKLQKTKNEGCKCVS